MYKKRTLIVLLALLSLVISSCNNKDEETTEYVYMTGTLTFTIPTYLATNDTIVLTPSGLTAPEGGIGYYWRTSWENVSDTVKTPSEEGDGSYTLITTSTIGQYTVTCYAYSEGYSNSSATETVYIVNPATDSTVTNLSLSSSPSFTDERDGKTYFTTTFGGKTWTRNNLGYSGSGVSYADCDVMDTILGRYYTWDEAQTACPTGWHLPSEAEFVQLADSLAGDTTSFSVKEDFPEVAGRFMGDAYFMGEKMWEFWPQVDITDDCGFSAIPVGYASQRNDSFMFKGFNTYSVFWTSDVDESDRGIIRYFYVEDPYVHVGYMDKSFLASVRCVKD